MRKRSVVILNRFLGKTEKAYSIQALAKEFDVSTKTIRNDIDDIDDFLSRNHLPMLNINHDNVIRLDKNSDINQIHYILDNLDLYTYRLSHDERTLYIMTTLLVQDSYISMQSLATTLNVTRNTIINDVDMIKEQLSYYSIDFMSSSKKGVLLKGGYLNKVRLLVDLYLNHNLMEDIPSFFQELIYRQLNAVHRYEHIFSSIKSIIQARDVVFLGDALYRLSALLFVILNYTDKQPLQHQLIPTKLDFLLEELGVVLKFDVTSNQHYFYQTYLDEFHLKDLLKSTNYIELYEIVRYFLKEVGKAINYAVENDDLLIESLVMHIKSANEMTEIVLPLKDDIYLPVSVSKVKQACEKHLHIVEKLLDYRFGENLKNAIILHICASLVRAFTHIRKLRIMIICASGMATGKYLEAQIKNYFNFEIVGVISARKITSEQLQKLSPDFIISSIPLDFKDIVCIQVNSKLTMNDLNTIQSTAFQFEKNAIKIISQKKTLIKRAEILFDGLDDAALHEFTFAFEQMIEKHEQLLSINGKVNIYQALKPKYIRKINKIIDWQEAIRQAEKPLLDYGYINNEYIEKSIQNVIEYGDYIVVSPNVALAHARSNDGVFKDGLSLLVSEQPIYLPNKSQVHLFFAFSTTGEKDYSELLKEIVALGKNPKNIEQIISAQNTIDIFYQLVK